MRRRAWLKVVAGVVAGVGAPACGLADRMTGEGEAKRIRRVGRAADALVLEIWDTGITLNDDPVVAFRLEVRPREGAPYEVETKGRVSRLHIPQVQPGATLPVVVDPEDPGKVALAMYTDR